MNFSPPFAYQDINFIGSQFHHNSIYYDSDVYWYHWRGLYERILSEFDVKTPDNWNQDLLMYCILCNGYIGVFDTKEANTLDQYYGILPLPATLSGVGVQWQPILASAVAPQLTYQIRDKTIYKDCGLITISPFYRGGVFDIIDRYAERLSLISSSLDQAIINSRHYYAAYANSPQGASTLKAMMDDRNSGKPFTVIDKKSLTRKDDPLGDTTDPISWVDFKVGSNYITDKILTDIATIYNDFDKEVGIPNNPQQDKKERLLSNEIESNSAESVARLTVWLNHLEESINHTKSVFPDLDLSITRHKYDTGETGAKEVSNAVESNTDRDV